jgi:hypothetical protein
MTIDNTEKKKILKSHFSELGKKSRKSWKEKTTKEERSDHMRELQKKSVEAKKRNKKLSPVD